MSEASFALNSRFVAVGVIALGASTAACSLVMDVNSLDRGADGGASSSTNGEPRDASAIGDGSLDVDAAHGALLLHEDFESFPTGESWNENTTHGSWFVAYAGSGLVDIEHDGTQALSLAPKASGPNQSFSSLVHTTARFADLDVTVRMKTVAQLRTPTPDPSETAEILWHLDAQEDRCNYFQYRAGGGWELGTKSFAKGTQVLLLPGTDAVTVTDWNTVHIRQIGAAITVTLGANGPTAVATDPAPAAGTLGLYVDDAHVRFDDVVVTAP